MAALGRLLQELRYPTTGRGKIIAATLALLVFSFLSLVVIGGFLLARVLTTPHAGETLDPTQLIGSTQALNFTTPDGVSHNGWFFPGMRGGPVIIVLHGYRSSRSEILTLASALQQHRYNVLAFNLAGHGESPQTYTSLGFKETEELLAALEMLSQRPDVDGKRIGLWGHSLGGHTALSAAVSSPSVKALVLDSVYPRPVDLLRLEMERMGAGWVPALGPITRLEFRLYTFRYSPDGTEKQLDRLTGMPKLFLSGSDQPGLAELTERLYERVPGPKQYVPLPTTFLASLGAEERSNYETQVVSFFLTNLPLVSP